MSLKTAIIYQIFYKENPSIRYVGSTLDSLSDRWNNHKSNYKKWLDGKYTGTSIYPYFQQYGINNFVVMLIKSYEVVDLKHLNVYETLWIKKLKAINKKEPCGGLLKKEYKKYFYKINKNKLKEYRDKNKEKIREGDRKYRERNIDWIREKGRIKIICECGLRTTKNNISRHEKTKKHQTLMAARA